MWWRRRERGTTEELRELRHHIELLRADVSELQRNLGETLEKVEHQVRVSAQQPQTSKLPTILSAIFWLISPVYVLTLIQWFMREGWPDTTIGRITLTAQLAFGLFAIGLGLLSKPDFTDAEDEIDWASVLRFRRRVISVWGILIALFPFLGLYISQTVFRPYALTIAIVIAISLSLGSSFLALRGSRRVKSGNRPPFESEILQGMTLQEGDLFLALSIAEALPLILLLSIEHPIQ